MVLELKFTRFEDQPWGFRLTGGSDFEVPLTVIKVTKGSIAETLGMQVNDVVVRVNDTPMSNLNHSQAHEVIMNSGNCFVMALLRPDSEVAEIPSEDATSPCHHVQEIQRPDSQAYSDMTEITIDTNRTDESCRSDENQSNEISDDHIAELISGEAELLKEHNVIGVNFQKIMPKSNVFKSSEVFRHLNEEAIKTKTEKENEVKKWTTFLQKPDRPVPKSKQDLENERRAALRYQIKICKQPKPKCDPNRTPTPPVVKEPEPEPQPEPVIELVPGPEPQYVEYLTEPEIVNTEAPTIEVTATDSAKQLLVEEAAYSAEAEPLEEAVAVPEKTEEELLLENQLLADVQKQLMALATLPSTIQATLEAVTKQLADLVPALKLQQLKLNEEKKAIEEEQEQTRLNEEPKDQDLRETTDEINENSNKSDEIDVENIDIEHDDADMIIEDETNCSVSIASIDDSKEDEEQRLAKMTEEEVEKQRMEKVFKKQEEDWLYKREKEQKRLEAEAKEKRLMALSFPKRLTKAQGGPLTPQERPLVLPGGRKWRNERDAYNEDFIAEVISSQAELIVGSTLGCTYESPLLGYDERVNFLKYKKPEKDLSNLQRSEVFKIIHMEHEPRHGIPARPAKIMAEQDIRNKVSSSMLS